MKQLRLGSSKFSIDSDSVSQVACYVLVVVVIIDPTYTVFRAFRMCTAVIIGANRIWCSHSVEACTVIVF
jgi:hypothetical protein